MYFSSTLFPGFLQGARRISVYIFTGNVIKQLLLAFSCWNIVGKFHGSSESTKEVGIATLTLLSCSPNFLRAL